LICENVDTASVVDSKPSINNTGFPKKDLIDCSFIISCSDMISRNKGVKFRFVDTLEVSSETNTVVDK
jgi:hypothetical protein